MKVAQGGKVAMPTTEPKKGGEGGVGVVQKL